MLWFMFVLLYFFFNVLSFCFSSKTHKKKRSTTTPKDFAFDVIKQAHMVTHDDTDFIASHLLAKCDRKKTLKLRDWCVIPFFSFACWAYDLIRNLLCKERTHFSIPPCAITRLEDLFILRDFQMRSVVSFDVLARLPPTVYTTTRTDKGFGFRALCVEKMNRLKSESPTE